MVRSAALTLTLCLATITAQGALVGRAPLTPGGTDYRAYYDNVSNITWVADAKLAQTSGYSAAGTLLNWAEAHAWTASLNTANYLGVNNWRLPITVQPDPTCTREYAPGQYGGQLCTASEMGYMLNVNGVSATSPGPFLNITPLPYFWSETLYAPDPSKAWDFYFYPGAVYQQNIVPVTNVHQVWAVRSGDIAAVPLPGSLWLLGTALGGLGGRRLLRRQATA